MKAQQLSHWLVFIGLIFPFVSIAQFDLFPCDKGNPELKKLMKGETIERLYVHSCSGEGMGEMATSFLKPSGTPPKSSDDPDDPNWGRYETWTCRYNPGNIADKNPKTAWVEGVDGYGIGEFVLVACLDFKKPVKIWNGYGKSEKLYFANGRVKTAKLYIVQAELKDVTQYGNVYGKMKVISQQTQALKDLNGYQNISVPKFEQKRYFNKMMNQETDYAYFLGIEILEVYKGTKYEDTCICEVSN